MQMLTTAKMELSFNRNKNKEKQAVFKATLTEKKKQIQTAILNSITAMCTKEKYCLTVNQTFRNQNHNNVEEIQTCCRYLFPRYAIYIHIHSKIMTNT